MNATKRRLAALALCGATLAAGPALADKIKNPTAVFSGLDKITGRIVSFEVAINETVQFGSLQITPRVCYSRPATEAPQTDVFAEVDEIGDKENYKQIFSGWMFAASPGLHGIEHPVYDIWLTDCKGGTQVIKTTPDIADAPEALPTDAAAASTDAKPAPAPKKRKPKPAAPPVVDAGPLDLGTEPPPVARAAPTRRFFPTDAPPIPPGDVGALAGAIADLLQRGREGRSLLGQAALLRVREKFTTSALQRATLAVYDRLIGRIA